MVDVLLICRKIVGEGHLVLSVHVTARHVHHAVTGSEIGHSECAAQWGSRSSTLHRKAVVIVGMLMPPGGSHRTLAVETGRRGSRRIQRREARSHRGAFTWAQRMAINFNSQTIRDLLSVRSHVVQVFSFERLRCNWVDDITCPEGFSNLYCFRFFLFFGMFVCVRRKGEVE